MSKFTIDDDNNITAYDRSRPARVSSFENTNPSPAYLCPLPRHVRTAFWNVVYVAGLVLSAGLPLAWFGTFVDVPFLAS